MKKLLTLIVALAPLFATAQTTADNTHEQKQKPLFGYFSQGEVLNAMSDKAAADNSLATLREKYDKEMKNSADEFNRRYQEFLEGQRSFAEPILRKRQAELQQMMEQNVAFRDEATRLLKEAERDIYAPLKQKINAAAAHIGNELGLAFVLNTDGDSLPFANPSLGIDITADMKALLK